MSKYIAIAKEYAFKKDFDYGKYRLCAIAFDEKDNILSVGYNSYTKSHPLQASFAIKAGHHHKIYLHAEIAALVRAKQPVYRLVVVRINNDGHLRQARPCPVCQLAIEAAGVVKIEHS